MEFNICISQVASMDRTKVIALNNRLIPSCPPSLAMIEEKMLNGAAFQRQLKTLEDNILSGNKLQAKLNTLETQILQGSKLQSKLNTLENQIVGIDEIQRKMMALEEKILNGKELQKKIDQRVDVQVEPLANRAHHLEIEIFNLTERVNRLIEGSA